MLLADVPPALTLALVDIAPWISACKYGLQIASWSCSWYSSWLALVVWWMICLLPLRPLFFFLAFALFPQSNRQTLSSETAFQNIIADLTIIQSLRPRFPPSPSLPLPILLRLALISYLAYLILSFFLSQQLIFAIAGTLLLSWRAPWALLIRTTLWRSAWFRWSIYTLWSHLTGLSLPPPPVSPQSLSDSSLAPIHSLRFLFTIYENQRWWVGLDWTAALLPAERPSWCSASHLPIPPPNAFTLPENTTVYLPDPKGNRMKRTAIWKWEEPEWRVLVRKDATGTGLTRLERPLSTESQITTRALKATPKNSPFTTTDEDHLATDSEETTDEDPLTDPDGWVYADNKWEQRTNRGGMGKYTRYRRWTRIAAVFETVELDVGPSLPQSPTEQEIPTTSTLVDQSSSSQHTVSDISSTDDPPESPLRHRLRMALNKASAPSL